LLIGRWLNEKGGKQVHFVLERRAGIQNLRQQLRVHVPVIEKHPVDPGDKRLVERWIPDCVASLFRSEASWASRSRAYRALFSSELDAAVITDIRQALNTGLVLGNDKFRKEVDHLTGQRQRHLKN